MAKRVKFVQLLSHPLYTVPPIGPMSTLYALDDEGRVWMHTGQTGTAAWYQLPEPPEKQEATQ
jgi:hypothetical protein